MGFICNQVIEKIFKAYKVSKNILDDMAKLFKLRRSISNDIEPVLLIDEEDPSVFLDSISKYGEVVCSE